MKKFSLLSLIALIVMFQLMSATLISRQFPISAGSQILLPSFPFTNVNSVGIPNNQGGSNILSQIPNQSLSKLPLFPFNYQPQPVIQKGTCDELKNQVDTLKQKIDQQSAIKASLLKQNQELKNSRDPSSSTLKIKQLEAKINDLVSLVDKQKKQIDSNNQKYLKLQKENNDLKNQISTSKCDDLQKIYTDTKNQLAIEITKSQGLNQENTDLKNKLSSEKQKTSQLQSQVSQCKSQSAKQTSQIQQLINDKNQLNNDLTLKASKITEFQNQIVGLKNQLASGVSKAKDLEKEITGLKEQVTSSGLKTKDLQKKITELNSQISSLNSKNSQLQSTINSYISQINSCQNSSNSQLAQCNQNAANRQVQWTNSFNNCINQLNSRRC